jgi:hypothetical protein
LITDVVEGSKFLTHTRKGKIYVRAIRAKDLTLGHIFDTAKTGEVLGL